jgi:hypothetical protein
MCTFKVPCALLMKWVLIIPYPVSISNRNKHKTPKKPNPVPYQI